MAQLTRPISRTGAGTGGGSGTDLLLGSYLTTMDPANTGAQNKAALEADVTAAAGQRIVVWDPGDYLLEAATTTATSLWLYMAPGAKFKSAAGVVKMLDATGTDVYLERVEADGDEIAERFIQVNGGTLIWDYLSLYDFGKTVGANTHQVIGWYANACTFVMGGYYKGRNFNANDNGSTGDNVGTVRHGLIYRTKNFTLDTFDAAGGTGEDNDYLQVLDDNSTLTTGVIKNFISRYNHYTRRNIKVQGGKVTVLHADTKAGTDFVGVASSQSISGAANNGSGLIRLTVPATDHFDTNQRVAVSGVAGTTEANGTWAVTVIDDTHVDLQGSAFVNAYTSGGTMTTNATLITGAANNGSGLIRVTVNSTTNFATGNRVTVSGVTGTTEANGTWTVTVISGTTMDLQGSAFVNAYVSGGLAVALTNCGKRNLNCMDYAASIGTGFLEIKGGYIDASAYVIGVGSSGGAGRATAYGCTIEGSPYNSIRINPDTGAVQNQSTSGSYAVAGGEGSGAINCTIKGFVKGAVLQGDYSKLINCTIDDPFELAFELGATAQSQGLDCIGNKVITRTAGYLKGAGGFCARINNIIDARIEDNQLMQDGNTTNNTAFIGCTDANAIGEHDNNTAPIGTIPLYVGSQSCGIIPKAGAFPRLGITAVGNVGTGEDDLQTFTLQPYTFSLRGAFFGAQNQRGVHIVQQGTFANNVNAKTLKLYAGGTLLRTETLPTSIAGDWRYELTIVGTSASAQDYTLKAYITNASGVVITYLYRGTLALTASATQIIKCTGEATTNNDIVSEMQTIQMMG